MRKLSAIFVILYAAAIGFAAEVDLAAAREFAHGWRGRAVKGARTVKSGAGAGRFHVVNFEGGGWAAVGVDDEESPVIAFSDNGEDLVEDERNAVWFLVKRDAERREVKRKGEKKRRGRHEGWKYRRGVGDSSSRMKLATGTVKTASSGIEDVRVAPMLKSTWNQESGIYNLSTPNNYPCGCVATMMAQMMRYFEWPKTSVTAQTFPCYVGETIPDRDFTAEEIVEKTMMGGVYDWNKMTLSPNSSTPLANKQEIGKLCYDVGVSVCMMWSSEGSGAYTANAREALVETWGYSNAHCVAFTDDFHPYDFDELRTIVISNCEAGIPVGYGISGTGGGHAVVIDGYGYTGDSFYVHINPGWGGTANAWYCPPNLNMGGLGFNSSDELIFNVFTEGTGSLVTGKVIDQYGQAVEGADVAAYEIVKRRISISRYSYATNSLATVRTDANGRYSFKTGKDEAISLYVKVLKNGFAAENTAALEASQTMRGYREGVGALNGSYYPRPYSLGNKCDFDFVLRQMPTPKVLFR